MDNKKKRNPLFTLVQVFAPEIWGIVITLFLLVLLGLSAKVDG